MLQINVPNDQLADFADQLRGHRVGIYSTTRRGLVWCHLDDVQSRGNDVALVFLGEEWDDDEQNFITVEQTVLRPTTGNPQPRTAVYVPERLADQILEQLGHLTARVGA